MTVYLISYFNNETNCREYYLNRSSFTTRERAEYEIKLIELREMNLYTSYNIKKKRTHFKIEPYEIKNEKCKIKTNEK